MRPMKITTLSIPAPAIPFSMDYAPMVQSEQIKVIFVVVVLFFTWQEVIEVCKKYLPNMAKGYSSPKLTQYIGDGFEYMKQHKSEFDVVITDSSDPIGMHTKLYF